MIPQYRKLIQNVNLIIKIARTVNDDFHGNQLAAHGCVLLSGAIESAVREIVPEFSQRKAHPGIANYVRISLRNFTNPNPDKLFGLLNQFDPEFEKKFATLKLEEIKDHLGSIVSNRHLIAHGKNTGISPNRLQEWKQSTDSFCTFLENNFAPEAP